MNISKNNPPINAIIFDLVGVLFTINSRYVFRSIGIRKLIFYFLRNKTNPIQDGLALLDKMRLEWPNQFQELIPYKGTYLPAVVCQWQQGIISSNQATDEIHKFINHLSSKNHFKNSYDKELLLKLMSLFVNPEVGIQALQIIKPMQKLVETLKKKNYQIYILSNIDQETFSHLKQKHQSFFDVFNDVITSFKTNLLKPEAEIFNYLLASHQLSAEQCCFIDDQDENLATALGLGIAPIKFNSYHKLRKKLSAMGIAL